MTHFQHGFVKAMLYQIVSFPLARFVRWLNAVEFVYLNLGTEIR